MSLTRKHPGPVYGAVVALIIIVLFALAAWSVTTRRDNCRADGHTWLDQGWLEGGCLETPPASR